MESNNSGGKVDVAMGWLVGGKGRGSEGDLYIYTI